MNSSVWIRKGYNRFFNIVDYSYVWHGKWFLWKICSLYVCLNVCIIFLCVLYIPAHCIFLQDKCYVSIRPYTAIFNVHINENHMLWAQRFPHSKSGDRYEIFSLFLVNSLAEIVNNHSGPPFTVSVISYNFGALDNKSHQWFLILYLCYGKQHCFGVELVQQPKVFTYNGIINHFG